MQASDSKENGHVVPEPPKEGCYVYLSFDGKADWTKVKLRVSDEPAEVDEIGSEWRSVKIHVLGN